MRCGNFGFPPDVRWLAAGIGAVTLFLAGCAAGQAPVAAGNAQQRVLEPWLSLTGARLAQALDSTGTPSLTSGPLEFRRFIHPVTATAFGNDVYIVDSGAGMVFRFDIALNIMAPVKGVPSHDTTRIFVGSDFSLYVLDAARRRVLQYARSGQLLATFSDRLNLVHPVSIAVDQARALVLVGDGTFNQIVAFHPLGGASYVISLRGSERNRVLSIGAMAMGADALYVSDPACRCIARIARDGTVIDTFGNDVIGQPGPIAVDRHERVFVADQFDRSIKIFMNGKLIHTAGGSELGMLQVSDLTIRDGVLALTDGMGARVQLMRISPPQPVQ